MENLKPSEILNVRDQANDTERKENMRHTKQQAAPDQGSQTIKISRVREISQCLANGRREELGPRGLRMFHFHE